MLLTKDERKLLTAYYLKITGEKGLEEVTKEKWYPLSQMMRILKSRNLKKAARELPDHDVGDAIKPSIEEEITTGELEALMRESKEYLRYESKVSVANNTLKKRELIAIRYGPPDSDHIGVSLTIKGFDLGRKYNGWYYKTGGMWWAEYKGHWIWSILAAILSFILGWLLRGAH